MKIVSWNICHQRETWHHLVDTDADVALLQEACEPPRNLAERLNLDPEPWRTDGAGAKRPWRTVIVGLNPSLNIIRLPPRALVEAARGDFGVSRLGTLAAAHVEDPKTRERFTLISMYGLWESPHFSTNQSWIYADASVHRLISDISGLVGRAKGHRLIAAGDLNVLHGYGEDGNCYWAARYQSIFDRFEAIGLKFVGPRSPFGIQAQPWPNELPQDSKNVPTFRTKRESPESATRQLDFVFASGDIAGRVQPRALNSVEEWGPSDHCRILIDVA